MALKLVALLCLAVGLADATFSYRNHKVLQVPIRHKRHAELISNLEDAGVDVWGAVMGKFAQLHVTPMNLESVNESLVEAGLMPEVVIQDIEALIEEERKMISEADAKRGRASWVGSSFVRYSEIESWIQSLPNSCGKKCAIENIGKSYEKRNIYAIRISNDVSASGNRPILFFEANIHAREWLSHASVAYIVQTLISSSDAKIVSSLNNYEWHFIVVANPDGYEYTWTGERLWRKTRSKQSALCYGVDPNRNFDAYHCGEGTSSNPCADTYCGPSAFSEKETQVIRDYTTPRGSRIKTFQSVHAYSQLILLPYSYTSNKYPPDFAELKRVAKIMADKIYATSKKTYTAGNVADLLYPAAGSTMDWARLTLGVDYPISWELRPNQNAINGFVVSPSEIIPTANELLQAWLAFLDSIEQE